MRRFEDIILNQNGTPVGNASVTVFLPGTQTKAILYSDDGLTPIINPVVTNPNGGPNPGTFSFFVASGKYDFQVSGSAIVTYTQKNVEIADIFEFKVTDTQPWNTQTLEFSNQTTGPTPPAGNVNLYSKSTDKNLYFKDDTGREVGPLGAASFSSNAALKPTLPGDPIQYVSPNGNDTFDGLSHGTAKLTVYAALLALPGGGGGFAGAGTVLISGNVAYGGPVFQQGMWLMGSSDQNYNAPPPGWLKWPHFQGSSLTIACFAGASSGANQHDATCQFQAGGPDPTLPNMWFSSINGPVRLLGLQLAGTIHGYSTAIRLGITSTMDRSSGLGGCTDFEFFGVSWGMGDCTFGGGPGMDIGNNSFWIWMKDITAGGCHFGTSIISTAVRTNNIITVTTTAPSSIAAGDLVTLQNVSDGTMNISTTVNHIVNNTTFVLDSSPSLYQHCLTCGPNSSSGNGQVITARSAAINIDPGYQVGSGAGLVFMDNINTQGGGSIRVIGGVNGSSGYVKNLSYEGDFVTPKDVPAVLVIGPNVVARADNITISDALVPVPDMRVDLVRNFGAARVGDYDGSLIGPMLVTGPQLQDSTFKLSQGQPGIFADGRLVAGGIDAGRRLFAPVAVRSASLIGDTSPAGWFFENGTGTITQNIPAPDGTLGAGRAVGTSAGVTDLIYFHSDGVFLNLGDWYIYGVWLRSVGQNGFTNNGSPVTFEFNHVGFGSGDTCTNFGGATLNNLIYPRFFNNGEWTFYPGLCQVASNPSVAGIALDSQVDQTHTYDVYNPTMLYFPAGSISVSEAFEIANNLSSYPAGAQAGTVAMLQNQLLQLGTRTFANLGTPNNNSLVFCADCTITNPCAGGGTGALAKRLGGSWICN